MIVSLGARGKSRRSPFSGPAWPGLPENCFAFVTVPRPRNILLAASGAKTSIPANGSDPDAHRTKSQSRIAPLWQAEPVVAAAAGGMSFFHPREVNSS
jgi:hypothetical protein